MQRIVSYRHHGATSDAMCKTLTLWNSFQDNFIVRCPWTRRSPGCDQAAQLKPEDLKKVFADNLLSICITVQSLELFQTFKPFQTFQPFWPQVSGFATSLRLSGDEKPQVSAMSETASAIGTAGTIGTVSGYVLRRLNDPTQAIVIVVCSQRPSFASAIFCSCLCESDARSRRPAGSSELRRI